MEARSRALHAFLLSDPRAKAAAAHALAADLDTLEIDSARVLSAPQGPGQPARPELVAPQQVARRSPFTAQGHAALMHAIAHIEFNAINLALDAVWRFAGLPPDYYRDWIGVAREEAQHFLLLHAHLESLGYAYGDFPAHQGLWAMAESTQDDVLARMALVPRTLEARGLDATPVIQAKLRRVDSAAARQALAILDTILDEEVGHVALGNRWFHWLCARDGVDPADCQARASARHGGPGLKPPFNLPARRRAGFSESELQALADIAASAIPG